MGNGADSSPSFCIRRGSRETSHVVCQQSVGPSKRPVNAGCREAGGGEGRTQAHTRVRTDTRMHTPSPSFRLCGPFLRNSAAFLPNVCEAQSSCDVAAWETEQQRRVVGWWQHHLISCYGRYFKYFLCPTLPSTHTRTHAHQWSSTIVRSWPL